MPLQVPDPQDEIRDLPRPGVGFQSRELARVDRHLFDLHADLGVPEVDQLSEHFPLKLLEQREGDVQEVPAATGRVEDADLAQVGVKSPQELAGLFLVLLGGLFVPLVRDLPDEAQRHRPVLADRLDHRGSDEPLYVLTGGEVGSQAFSLAGVECPFDKGAEDGGLHVGPVAVRSIEKLAQLGLVQGQRLRRGEQPTVEPEQLLREAERQPLVHRLPQPGHPFLEGVRLGHPVVPNGVGEHPLGDQLDVLSEHREEAPHQERRGRLCPVFRLKAASQIGKVASDLLGDLRRLERGVQLHRVGEDQAEEVLHLRLDQGCQGDGLAGTVAAVVSSEAPPHLEDVADVAGHDERWLAVVDLLGVAVSLAERGLHRLVPPPCAASRCTDLLVTSLGPLLGLDDEVAPLVEVDVAGGLHPVVVDDLDLSLETEVGSLVRGWVGSVDPEEVAQLHEELLVDAALLSP